MLRVIKDNIKTTMAMEKRLSGADPALVDMKNKLAPEDDEDDEIVMQQKGPMEKDFMW